jgi:hypothetical protein
MKDSKVYYYNGLFILATFGLVRILIIPPYWYILLSTSFSSPYWHLITKKQILYCYGGGMFLDILNCHWYSKIIKICKKHFSAVDNKNKDYDTFDS